MGFFLYYSALRVADLNCSRKVYMAFRSVSYVTDHNFSQKLKKINHLKTLLVSSWSKQNLRNILAGSEVIIMIESLLERSLLSVALLLQITACG